MLSHMLRSSYRTSSYDMHVKATWMAPANFYVTATHPAGP